MRRREFITLLGAAAAAWPRAAGAQQPGKVWRIGFVAGGARPVPLESFSTYAGFLQGMRELGYDEGRDFIIEWRFAEGRYELFPDFGMEFARLKVDLIVSSFSGAIPAMRQANPNIPIVMGYATDPVGLGLVASLARPGGNITGLASSLDDIAGKQVDLLVTSLPNLSRVAVLTNPANLANSIVFKSIELAGRQAGITVVLVQAASPQDIESAFSDAIKEDAGALIVAVDALFLAHRQRIAELALRHRLPSVFGQREYVEAGGLMSYGDSMYEFLRRSATYVSKIFKGAKPNELPIEQPTHFHLVINRKTADALDFTISPMLYVFANEVIE